MSQSNFIELVTADFAAGQSRNFMVSGQYFELIDAPESVDVFLVDRFGAQRGVMRAAEASFNLKSTEFNEIQIVSPTAQTIRFAYGSGEAGTRRSAGAVTISGTPSVNVANTGGSFVQMQQTVPSIVATISNAKSRRYFMVQNKSATGTIWVYLGFGATTNNGVRLGPGDSLEYAGYAPNSVITAIGDIASNPDVVIVEASV